MPEPFQEVTAEEKQSQLEALASAEEVRRLRRADTVSLVADWEASFVKGSDSRLSLQSELSAALSGTSDTTEEATSLRHLSGKV